MYMSKRFLLAEYLIMGLIRSAIYLGGFEKRNER